MTGKAFYHRAFNNAGAMILGAKMSGNSQVALATPTTFLHPALPRCRRGLATSAHLLPARQHPQHPGHTALPVGPIPAGSGAWMAGETAGRWPGERRDEQSLAPLQPQTPRCRRETPGSGGTHPSLRPTLQTEPFHTPWPPKGTD